MTGFLTELGQRFGSIEGYVESIGVTGSTIASLRRRYLAD